jgi:hypothetical protein
MEPPPPLIFARLRDYCVIVALRGCVIVALQGCVIVALQGCVIVVSQNCVNVAKLRDCCVARLLCKVALFLHYNVALLLCCKVV